MNQKESLQKLTDLQSHIDRLEFSLKTERMKLLTIVRAGNPDNDRHIEDTEGAICTIQRAIAAKKQQFNNELLLTRPYVIEPHTQQVFYNALKSCEL
jgi:hypothetical protein